MLYRINMLYTWKRRTVTIVVGMNRKHNETLPNKIRNMMHKTDIHPVI